MVNDLYAEQESFVKTKLRRRGRYRRRLKAKAKLKANISLTICFFIIITTSIYTAYNSYIANNSKDLSFAVEYNFTHGFSSKNKLYRVQQMSLVHSDENTAIVTASGLSKAAPHYKTSITGSFKKDKHQSWNLENVYTSEYFHCK